MLVKLINTIIGKKDKIIYLKRPKIEIFFSRFEVNFATHFKFAYKSYFSIIILL